VNCDRCKGTKVIGVTKVYDPVTGKVIKKARISCPDCR
jgi:hypothetical protein